LVDEFDGAVEDYDVAAEAIKKMNGADIALLANHGVFVLGDSVAEAYFRCYSFEWRCQRAIEVSAIGEGVPLRPNVHSALSKMVVGRGMPGFWDAAIKRSVLRRPMVVF
jgi:ribulose-5-phosphate 4-epimerase/fuculose-1-phosphate aldolase